MLWFNKEANDRGWLGLGLVACHRRSKALTRSYDAQPYVRNGGNCPRRRPYCYRSRSSQNNEGENNEV